jgi:hypothetical protein
MVRGVLTRLVSAAGALVVVVVATVGLAPAAAHAAPKPKPPKPTAITITGKGMSDLKIQAKDRPEIFQLLLSEVSWLANATPQTAAPKSSKLGERYTLTVLAGNKPQQVYEMYPLATGGPRAHRPAKQPSGKKADGWFYGRLTMSESLRVSGVPLEARTDVVNGGIGGGAGETVAAEEIDPLAQVNSFVDQMQRLFLLNGAVLVVILFGLAGIAFMIRRRV